MFKSGVSDPEKCPKVRRPCAAMNEGYRVIAGIVIGDCSPAGTSRWLASIGISATVTTDRDVVRAADAVTFTSSCTVANLCDAIGPGQVPAVVVSIGPITSATARERGLAVAAEADPHTIDGLVATLLGALA